MKITIEIDDLKKKPMDEVEDEEMDKVTDSLPKNTVKVDEEEDDKIMDQNSKPIKYTVKKGDTLRSIAEKFGISYAELSAKMLSEEGSTSLHQGQDIRIPRHFIDMSKAE